jgi:hypothetical protein
MGQESRGGTGMKQAVGAPDSAEPRIARSNGLRCHEARDGIVMALDDRGFNGRRARGDRSGSGQQVTPG